MRYAPATLVWVRCDDGLWWPARVREVDAEMRAFLSDDEDCCVDFFHSPGELYPVNSTDDSRVHIFHAEPHARTAAEAQWFACAEVAPAVSRALREHERLQLMRPPTMLPDSSPPSADATAATTTTTATTTATTTPFSAAELRNIQALLGAVNPETSRLLRQQLHQAHVSVAKPEVVRQERREKQARKRQRAANVPPPLSPVVQEWQAQVVQPSRPLSPSLPAPPASASSASFPSSSSPLSSASPASPGGGGSNDGSDALPFVPAARRRVVEVLRHEVFENPARFVLSPIYHFVEMLGAVAVENRGLATTLPSPRALRETPANGFSPHRRVLLVPLTEDYAHTSGWMVPTELDGVSLSMSLFVNDALVPLPLNWQLSPAKEAAAVKTAVSVDITDAVLEAHRDLFSLQVVFSGDVEEMEMWRGIIACVFVEEVGLARLGERIVSTYRKPSAIPVQRRSPSHTRSDGGVVDITEASVKLQCPITTMTMEIPVRSVHCEHLQCMELAAVLVQCVRQNVWNCPLCMAAMRPEEICVNYRLKNWIASHPQQLSQVEYVVETAPGSSLKVVYREAKRHCDSAVEVVDDD